MDACIPSLNKPNPTHGYALRVIDGKRQYEHVAAWVAENGPVPDGMVLDHICHDPAVCDGGPSCPHRACRNPAHLTPVTRSENVSRGRTHNPNRYKTHCKENHEFTPENTYIDARGSRICRRCRARHKRNWKQRRLSRMQSV